MSNVLPFGPTQHAERVDKRFATARGRVALLGKELRRTVTPDGATTFAIGMQRFRTIDEVEDFLDLIVGDDERASP